MIVGRKISGNGWTAVVAATLLFLIFLIGVTIPVPYVIWSPGNTLNLNGEENSRQIIQIDGIKTYPHSGELYSVQVDVTKQNQSVGMLSMVLAYLSSEKEVLPRDLAYPRGRPADEPISEDVKMVDIGALRAAAAALRAAGVPVTERPMVSQVLRNGPSDSLLFPGDLIVKVSGKDVKNDEDIKKIIKSHKIGDVITFEVIREGNLQKVQITSTAPVEGVSPVVGLTIATGYSFDPTITYRMPPDFRVAGTSLPMALTIYNRLSKKPITGFFTIASAGSISGNGDISPVGGIQERLVAAHAVGAKVFIMPVGSCADVKQVPPGMRLVAVSNLKQAIDSLYDLESGNEGKVKGCGNG